MILPFLVPLLGFLEVALVFYPLVMVLIVLSIFCLPADLTPLSHQSRRPHEGAGNPSLSFILSIFVYGITLYHFGISVGSWKQWVTLLGIYLVLGIVWSTAKWWLFCGKVRDSVKEVVDRFMRTVEDDDNSDDVERGFMSHMASNGSLQQYKSLPYMHEHTVPWPRKDVIAAYVPLVTSHKGIVLTWLFCWPMSVLKWALADMLRDLYNAVFSAIKGAFQKIAASRFTDI
jgi:hypothetical protein